MDHFRRVSLFFLVWLSQPFGLIAQVDDLPIGKIYFEGNEAFTEEQLKGLMKLRAVRAFAFRDQPFSRRALRIDALTLEGFYASQGYLESSVTDSFAVNPSGQVDVYLIVIEGRQFMLADIEMTGNRLLSTAEILTFLDLEPGEPFNPVYIRHRLDELRRYYQNQGKLTIDILDEKEADGDVYLRLFISEGLTYAVGGINVTGLVQVPEKFVRRELLFKTGDTFRQDDLVLSQQRIFESGLFAAVEILPEIQSLESGIANLEIRVRELERRSIDLTVGFEQKEDPGSGEPSTAVTTSGQWWHSRILGTSIRSGITLEPDLVLQAITSPNLLASWEFQAPWTLGIRIPSSIKFFSDYQTTPYRIYETGVDVTLMRRRVHRSRFTGRFRWAFTTAEEEVLDSVATAGANRSINFDYLFQGVDNLLAPRKGTIFQINPSLNGMVLEGVDKVPYYLKLEADIRRYHPVGRESVFAYRAKLGYLQTLPAGGGRSLPLINLFDLGGSTSLRGWSRPKRFSGEGGMIKMLGNVELRFPLIWILGAEMFLDMGALKAFKNPYTSDLEWKSGWDTGIGLLITTPLGPIRLDAAWPQGQQKGSTPIYQMAFLYTF